MAINSADRITNILIIIRRSNLIYLSREQRINNSTINKTKCVLLDKLLIKLLSKLIEVSLDISQIAQYFAVIRINNVLQFDTWKTNQINKCNEYYKYLNFASNTRINVD